MRSLPVVVRAASPRSVSTPVRLLPAPLVLGVLLGCVAPLAAQIPPGYYASVDTTSPGTLRASLHAIIDDHQFFPYTSAATDTWDILELAQQDPADAGDIVDVYRNESFAKIGGGVGPYEREHTWPRSYGFPDEGSSNSPHNDCHMLWLADGDYNGARGNKPFRACPSACSEYVTLPNGGQGGGSGSYPGQSNWTSGSGSSGTWEVWMGRRGDVARALLYADLRYEGGIHGVTGQPEPDLILTDSEALIEASNTGNNEAVAYMGLRSILLQWHADDPVDDSERERNDVVASFQGNRNPFVDHPEWVACVFQSSGCGGSDVTPPAPPTGLSASGGPGTVDLDWTDSPEGDLAGYSVYRSLNAGGPFTPITGGLLGSSGYVDTAVLGGTTYHYVVTATDLAANESEDSVVVSATPSAPAAGQPWINEFHYDNAGTDAGECVEVAGPAGLSLTGWSLVGYNGSGGAVYATVPLSGTLPDQGGCLGTASVAFAGLQNGGPDGIALVDPQGAVQDLLSYEGSFSAVGGPAGGQALPDIGVSETGTTPIGFSLQLSGSGAAGGDFAWLSPTVATPGALNVGQAFAGCPANPWTDLGSALPGVSGAPLCAGTGSLVGGTAVSVSLTNAAPSALAWIVIGLSALNAPFKGGVLVPNPDFPIGIPTSAGGTIVVPATWPVGVPSGFITYFQWWIQDAAGPLGFAASNGLGGTAP